MPENQPRRDSAFFYSDVCDSAGKVLQDAEDHESPREFILAVISELKKDLPEEQRFDDDEPPTDR